MSTIHDVMIPDLMLICLANSCVLCTAYGICKKTICTFWNIGMTKIVIATNADAAADYAYYSHASSNPLFDFQLTAGVSGNGARW